LNYHEQMLQEYHAREAEGSHSLLSSAWSRGRKKQTEPELIVQDLIEIMGATRNLVRIHGVPQGTQIKLTSLEIAPGASTFGYKPSDLDDWGEPLILLDKCVYEMCPEKDILDAYCGIAIHEAGHLWNSKELMQIWELRAKNEETAAGLKHMENLLEDDRIERIERERSPGFAPYVQRLINVLFVEQEVGKSLRNFDSLPDIDKARSLIFGMVRAPLLVEEEHKKFKLVNGKCPYADINGIMDKVPETVDEVFHYAKLLHEYLQEQHQDYKDTADSEEKMKKLSKEDQQRVKDQMEADKKDAEMKEKQEALEELMKQFQKQFGGKTAEEISKALEEGEDFQELREELEKLAKDKKELESREGRMGENEVNNSMKRLSERENLELDEVIALVKAELDRLEIHHMQHIDMDRRSVVIHPRPTDYGTAMYNNALDQVRGHVNRMRNAFRFRLGDKTYNEYERPQGRVHQRRLSQVHSTNKIFKTSRTVRQKGIAICLLVDESGSMGRCWQDCNGSGKAETAFRITTLIAQALKGMDGIELEIYSYNSCGEDHKDSLLSYLYGKRNPNMASLGAYRQGDGYMNYDNMAIDTAADLFVKNTVNTNRVMLMMSDGCPNGHYYGGPTADNLTAKAAKNVEKKGISFLHIAIDEYDNSMFPKSIKFLDMNDLINRMRILITQIVKKAT